MNSLILMLDRSGLTVYLLDNKSTWSVGRRTVDNKPDIAVNIPTVSRKHGSYNYKFGEWFYTDGLGKNGTIYNGKHIEPGKTGKARNILLSDGDAFLFGKSSGSQYSDNVAKGVYIVAEFNDEYRKVNTGTAIDKIITFSYGKETMRINNPEVGLVLHNELGAVVYMGNTTYLLGESDVSWGD